MEWMINTLEIQNFKSIKKQSLKPKRINVFIGKPNVGKSNILEAISLLGGFNSRRKGTGLDKKYLSDIVRYEKFSNLFYDNDRTLELSIESNLGGVFSKYHLNSISQYDLLFSPSIELKQIFSGRGQFYNINANLEELRKLQGFVGPNQNSKYKLPIIYNTVYEEGQVNEVYGNMQLFLGNIKKYEFNKSTEFKNTFSAFLNPPFGDNITTMLESNPKIFNDVAEIFSQYGLQLLLDNQTNSIEVIKILDKRIYRIPYALCADTLQRYIFNLLAIKTNKESVIILEEPEAHSFPKYIVDIANEIIDNKSNQYFIATHSPYLLTDFLEKCEENELGLFICDFKNYETTIRELSREEISNIKETGIDLFYNLPAFQND